MQKYNKNIMDKTKKEFNYKQQYGIVVICQDEEEQKKLYEELLKMGLTLKVVTV